MKTIAESQPNRLRDGIKDHLARLYPDHDVDQLARQCLTALGLSEDHIAALAPRNLWTEKDCLLITYGDSLYAENTWQEAKPLEVLNQFLDKHLHDEVSAVHILPFYPWTSDDGFSVSDYDSVHSKLGSWADISALSERYRVMSDCVINHCSADHIWFQNFQKNQNPGADYFIEADPEEDLSTVARPRTTPLLRPTETSLGPKHIWCTFSHDQIDLNFANPEVLLEFLHIFRRQLEAGVRAFRLDAVGYIWKDKGTTCLNLPCAHEIVRLIRSLVESVCPDAWIITETNVPNIENLAYFGNANEAHLIYNFSLPPLLINALLTGNSQHLRSWMMTMPPARDGTAYLNFIASHDGIGLRPIEGLLDDQERDAMIHTLQSFGGQVSSRAMPGGKESPYEINISLISAFSGTIAGPDQWQLERFLCAHAIMIALEGIPGIYIHSWLGSENDLDGVSVTGRPRSINRAKLEIQQLEAELSDPQIGRGAVLTQMKKFISIRQNQPAFHPNATQFTLQLGNSIFAFWRQSRDREQAIFCINNLRATPNQINLADLNLTKSDHWRDLIADQSLTDTTQLLTLAPYQSVWLSNR